MTRRRDSSRLPGDWSDLIVICSANYWHGMRYQERHIAEHLSKNRPILFVDPPLSLLTARKHPEYASALEGPRLRLVTPSIARLTPLALPGPFRPWMTRVTAVIARRRIAAAVRELEASVDAVIVTGSVMDVFGACDERVRIYWAQDDFGGGADLMGRNAERTRRGEERLAVGADELIAANPVVAQLWEARGYQPHLIPFGCDDEIFADVDSVPLPDDVALEPPVVGFVGILGSRIDFSLVNSIAERGHSMLLVGPRHWLFDIDQVDRLLARPNVCWVGPKEFEELPSYLRIIDVGIVPYADSAFNRGSFPLKTLEYLSAGRAAVATDLPAIRWLNTDLITVATTPEAFADAVGVELARPRTTEIIDRRQSLRRKHSRRRRAEAFATVIDQARAAR